MRQNATSLLNPDLREHFIADEPGPSTDPSLPDILARKLHREHASTLLPSLLRFGDSISMAHSVESRLPFMDYRLVEFVFQLPFHLKSRGRWSKYILRASFEKELPDEIRLKVTKLGFNCPIVKWLSDHVDDTLVPLLTGPRARERGLCDYDRLKELVTDVRNGQWKSARLVFRYIGMELWFQEYVDREWG